MFKQIMSDFAFNRAIEKLRKRSKIDFHENSTVIASLLESQSKNQYSENRSDKIQKLLVECSNRAKVQIKQDTTATDFDNDDIEYIQFVCAVSHAVVEQDVDDSFIYEGPQNQIKILVNLKLLPESWLNIDIKEESVA